MTHRSAEKKRRPWPWPWRACIYHTVIVWSLALVLIGITQNSGAIIIAISAISAIGGAFGALAGGLGALMDKKIPWTIFPRWPEGIPPWRLILVMLVINCAITGTQANMIYSQSIRTIDATAQIILGGEKNLLPGTGDATLSIKIKPWRQKAQITLESRDHEPQRGTCRAGTEFRITPRFPGGNQIVDTFTASPGEAFDVSIASGADELLISVAIYNTLGDMNCAIDLYVAKAELKYN